MTLQSETQPAAQDRQGSAAQHLADLIGFDTVSRNGNRPLIDHMAAYLEGLGARITILSLPGAGSGVKMSSRKVYLKSQFF